MGRIAVGTVAQLIGQCIQVQRSQQVIDGFRTHFSNELVGVSVFEHLVLPGKGIQNVQIFLFREEVIFVDAVFSLHTRLNDNVTFVVDNGIKLFGRQSEQVANLVGQ